MKQKLKILSIILFITIAFTIIANSLQIRLNTIRKENKLVDTDIIQNAPPVIAFTTIALGSFRGILADILWLRAIRLQDMGQYFEMVQLASWITKLQPRFTGVTAYLAWNMAYNISVTCSSFEDRWRWVQKGIELLRDEALVYNPADANLYKELGWIYQHKIGNIMDDANLYYKNQMTIEFMKVFGAPFPNWQKIASAPDDINNLLSQFPEINKFIINANLKNLDELERYFRKNGKLPELSPSPISQETYQLLDASLRKKWLKEVYKLDPARILELNQKYGELDWRLPEAHAIYWATLGITYDKSGEININCDRMITQSLKEAFMGGKVLIYDPNDYRHFMTVPNLNLADAVRKTFEEAYQRQKSQSFRGALENFLIDATVLLYTFGQYSKAEEFLQSLRTLSPNNPKFKNNLDNFVLKEWTEDVQLSTPRQAMDIISGLLFRTLTLLAGGDRNSAAAHERLALAVYNRYYFDQKESWGRMGLPPFEQIKRDITKKALETFPENIARLLKHELEILEREKTKTDIQKEL